MVQGVQLVAPEPSVLMVISPAPQGVQLALWAAAEKEPGGQALQAWAPASAKVPAGLQQGNASGIGQQSAAT